MNSNNENIEITASYCGRFPSSLRIHFHDLIYKTIESSGLLSLLNISEALFSKYHNLIIQEMRALSRFRPNAITQQIREKDKIRKKYVTYIFRMVNAAQFAIDEEIVMSANNLGAILQNYKDYRTCGIHSLGQLIDSLIIDLKNPNMQKDIDKLQMEKAITALETANHECINDIEKRSDMIIGKKIDNVLVLRPQTDAAFREICNLIYASQLVCTDAETLIKIRKLIAKINAIIVEHRKSYRQSIAQKRAAKLNRLNKNC